MQHVLHLHNLYCQCATCTAHVPPILPICSLYCACATCTAHVQPVLRMRCLYCPCAACTAHAHTIHRHTPLPVPFLQHAPYTATRPCPYLFSSMHHTPPHAPARTFRLACTIHRHTPLPVPFLQHAPYTATRPCPYLSSSMRHGCCGGGPPQAIAAGRGGLRAKLASRVTICGTERQSVGVS